MEPVPQTTMFSEEEAALLRAFVVTHQAKRGQERGYFALVALLVVAGFAASQLLIRWLPGHLAARGLAVCQRHATVHHGSVWLPADVGFTELLRLPGACGMLYAYGFGMVALAFYLHQRRARRVTALLARLLSGQTPAR